MQTSAITSNIGDALFTKSQQKVLGILFSNAEESFYTNDIVRRANMGKGTISRELEKLVQAGILLSELHGNQRHFQANTQNPIYTELSNIVRKTFGLADALKKALSPLEDSIQLAFIYGSIASGTEKPESDIDLMIISESLQYITIVETLFELGREINPVILSSKECKKRLAKEENFLRKVLGKDTIDLIGKSNDIRALKEP